MRKSIYRIVVCACVAWLPLTSICQTTLKLGHGPKMGVKKMNAVPEVGSLVKPSIPLFKLPASCLVGSARLFSCFTAVVNGISYQVAYSKTEAGKYMVEEVRTADPHFKTAEGLSIGNVVTVTSNKDLTLTAALAFDGRSDGNWLPILGEIPGPVIVTGTNGDTWIAYDDLHLTGKPIQLKISGFVLENDARLAASHGQL
jgi:hypothetical protein